MEFWKRNFVWVAILLCVVGVVLSVIGIPAKQPLFFIIGFVLSIPTICYLFYQVFIRSDKADLEMAPATNKISTANITAVVVDKNDPIMTDTITDDSDLEPLYNGYANDQEIAKRLHEVTALERERALTEDLPEIILPTIQPNNALEMEVTDQTETIQATTQNELLRQLEAVGMVFEPEIPAEMSTEPAPKNIFENEPTFKSTDSEFIYPNDAELITLPNNQNRNIDESMAESSPASTDTALTEAEPYTAPSLTDPNFVPLDAPVITKTASAPQPNLTPVDLTNSTVIHINAQNVELRKQKVQEKKALLSQMNLEHYLQRYFIETAACFLLDRTIYKDKYGLAPYNKFAVNKTTNLPEYIMSCTKGRLYKFCTYLIDTERFITHPALYNDFINAADQGIPLARISETLHPLYRKKYKKDFVLNLANREDWDNVMILVYNNYILNNDNFKDVFIRVPFEIPTGYTEENIIEYLKDPALQERFADRYPALEEIGIPTFWDALYICFVNSVRQKLSIEQIENAILRDYKKITRALKRADNTRRKLLKKAS